MASNLPRIDSGRLRHRIRIERLELSVDSNGDVIQDDNTGATTGTWTEVAKVWAMIEPLSAKEFAQSQATQAQITARIVIRHRAGLDSSMRLVHLINGAPFKVYNPHGFLADKDSGIDYLTIPCSEGVSESGQ